MAYIYKQIRNEIADQIETWIGVGLLYPNASQARSKGRDKFSSMNDLAWNEAPSEFA